MKIFLDIVSVSPIEIAADMFSLFAPWILGGAVVIGAVILIAKAVKRKK
ncbi:MAG: hypothetical protein IIX33_03200 [Oscillospiraceae bacterium]|nr:hypothetical protein [Oscillospiraceae bacterium]